MDNIRSLLLVLVTSMLLVATCCYPVNAAPLATHNAHKRSAESANYLRALSDQARVATVNGYNSYCDKVYNQMGFIPTGNASETCQQFYENNHQYSQLPEPVNITATTLNQTHIITLWNLTEQLCYTEKQLHDAGMAQLLRDGCQSKSNPTTCHNLTCEDRVKYEHQLLCDLEDSIRIKTNTLREYLKTESNCAWCLNGVKYSDILPLNSNSELRQYNVIAMYYAKEQISCINSSLQRYSGV